MKNVSSTVAAKALAGRVMLMNPEELPGLNSDQEPLPSPLMVNWAMETGGVTISISGNQFVSPPNWKNDWLSAAGKRKPSFSLGTIRVLLIEPKGALSFVQDSLMSRVKVSLSGLSLLVYRQHLVWA